MDNDVGLGPKLHPTLKDSITAARLKTTGDFIAGISGKEQDDPSITYYYKNVNIKIYKNVKSQNPTACTQH
jgi:hypothetical protein